MPVEVKKSAQRKPNNNTSAASESGEPKVFTAAGPGDGNGYRAKSEDGPTTTTVDPTLRAKPGTTRAASEEVEPSGAEPGPADAKNKAVKAAKSTTKKAS